MGNDVRAACKYGEVVSQRVPSAEIIYLRHKENVSR